MEFLFLILIILIFYFIISAIVYVSKKIVYKEDFEKITKKQIPKDALIGEKVMAIILSFFGIFILFGVLFPGPGGAFAMLLIGPYFWISIFFIILVSENKYHNKTMKQMFFDLLFFWLIVVLTMLIFFLFIQDSI